MDRLVIEARATVIVEPAQLNAKIPYFSVLPDGRRLKTDGSLRGIPLIGAALAVLKAKPDSCERL
jgi:hypothetical protein